MIEIGRTIVSLDLLEAYFLCHLEQCKGMCCVVGESGAPLTREEAKTIEKIYPKVKSWLPEKNQKVIEESGFSVVDSDGDLVTPLVENHECAFAFRNGQGIVKCSIEKAHDEGKVKFRKPISCHLYPVRITEYEKMDAVNYEKVDICSAGRICGKTERLPLFQFLKEPLIRKYGKAWYAQLEAAVELYNT